MTKSSRVLGLVLMAVVVAACGAGSAGPSTTPPAAPSTSTTTNTAASVGDPYRFFIHCGMRYIQNIDGRNWETTEPPYDGVGPFPDELRQAFLDPDEAVSPIVLGSIEITADDTLVFRVRNSDLTVTYRPTTATIPPCA